MNEQRTCFVSTPIYYVNDVPHPGHAYTTIAADALVRSRRLQGRRVFFLTGTDEHGQNIERIAREKGVPEQEYCDRIAATFKRLWERLEIRHDRFIRTTEEIHRRGVLKLWGRLIRARTPDGREAVYRGPYTGWYCPRCEEFKDEDELRQPGNLCAIHERPCEWTEEENLFFRLSAYEQWLRDSIQGGAIRIDPQGRRAEVLAMISQGLHDLSVTRARVKWGIQVPDEPGHVFYVWFDALANYITALGYADEDERYRMFWVEADERLHLIGKEIIRFHCVAWPAMLYAAAVPVPNRFFAHGHLTKEGRKLSKTTGNIIDTDRLLEEYGVDAMRYFLLREGSFGQDWDFTDEAFLKRYNSDLANDLGNLVSRALTMVVRYCEGRVPAAPVGSGRPFLPPRPLVFERYEELDFAGALAEIWRVVSELNQQIVRSAPWQMAKDPARRSELEHFLYALLEEIRWVALAILPVMPRAAARVLAMLGLADRESVPADLEWGRLRPGTPLATLESLFPRLERNGATGAGPAVAAQKEKTSSAPKEKTVTEPRTPPPAETTQAAAPDAGRIDISDFGRLELRAARVTAAEKVPGSKKLVRLQVDLGDESRQVVAGIAEAYAPEALVGKTVVLLANLKPAKLMGIESNGMVLAGSHDGKAVLCVFDGDVPPGAKVK
jgi:methionyl-tRNA synthetase